MHALPLAGAGEPPDADMSRAAASPSAAQPAVGSRHLRNRGASAARSQGSATPPAGKTSAQPSLSLPTAAVPSPVPVIGDAAMQSLMVRLLAEQRTAGQKFHLLVVPDDDWPYCEEYDSVEDLIAAVREKLGQACHLFPFLGARLRVTAGPMRYLKTPYGSLPLFDVDETEPAAGHTDGWVGGDIRDPDDIEEELDEDEAEDTEHAASADPADTAAADEARLLMHESQSSESAHEYGEDAGYVEDQDTPVL